jgi:hypothetical protein
MLKLFFFFIKLGIFAIIILTLGVSLQWNHKNLSEHVQIQVANAKNSKWFRSLKEWSKKITREAQNGLHKQWSNTILETAHERISDQDKDRLKNLIKELNESSEPAAP